jgi:hypothetical protein
MKMSAEMRPCSLAVERLTKHNCQWLNGLSMILSYTFLPAASHNKVYGNREWPARFFHERGVDYIIWLF